MATNAELTATVSELKDQLAELKKSHADKLKGVEDELAAAEKKAEEAEATQLVLVEALGLKVEAAAEKVGVEIIQHESGEIEFVLPEVDESAVVAQSLIDSVNLSFQESLPHVGDGCLHTLDAFVYVGAIGFNDDEGYRRDPIRDRVIAIARRAIDDKQIGSMDSQGEQTFSKLPNFNKTNRIRVAVIIEKTQ
jgi:hypothetical protein